jgi:phosphopantothenoylcysteine decarboxylase / phosphopantothenate---cysteine ligase
MAARAAGGAAAEDRGPRVVLGVSGGIAAYKACELLRRLTESGHDVTVVPTEAALHFVGEATWAALSGRPAATRVWEDVHEVPHVRTGQQADLVVVAPATADTHPATRENVATLRRRGAVVIEPAVGRLTGVDTGKGRLPDPDEIFAVCRQVLLRGDLPRDLAGRHVVISAGGTREPLDPVRYLGNRSSGKQGYALARTAVARGARVTLVAANTGLADPAGADVVPVGTALEMRDAVLKAAADADAVVMAAAVADFRPARYAESKIKKRDGEEPAAVALTRNPDILAEISADRPRPGLVVVGFAAETDDALANGRAKLARKGCDLLVVNEVGENTAFGTDDNAAVLLGADGTETEVPLGPKEALADRVWDLVATRLPGE